MNNKCGCCEGVEQQTPAPIANRPGLPALAYRAGTHASFLESMKARLTGLRLNSDQASSPEIGENPLDRLTTREPSDPSMALLDGWATVGDVLTFYQERIANEGYLRTATERRSVVELARLVGYQPRPGVASSVHLAFKLEDLAGEVVVPASTGAKSIPGQNERLQTFETSEDLPARPQWNELKARQSQPHDIPISRVRDVETIYLQGTAANLGPNDPLVLVIEGRLEDPIPRRVQAVTPDFVKKRTKVELQSSLLSPALFQRRVFSAMDRFRLAPHFGPQLEPPSLDTEILRLLTDLTAQLAPTSPLTALDGNVQATLPKLSVKLPPIDETQTAFGELTGQVGTLVAELTKELNSGPAQVRTKLSPILKGFWANGGAPPADLARRVIDAMRQIPDQLNANDEISVMRGFVSRFLRETLKPAIADANISAQLKAVLTSLETRTAPDFGIRQIVSSFPNNTAVVADHFKDPAGNVDFDDEPFDENRPPIGSRPIPNKSLTKAEFQQHVSKTIAEFVGKESEEVAFVLRVKEIIRELSTDLASTNLQQLANGFASRLPDLGAVASDAEDAGYLILAARIRDLRVAIDEGLRQESIRLFTVVRDAYTKPNDPQHEQTLTRLIAQIEALRKLFVDAIGSPPGPTDPLGTLAGVVNEIEGDDELLGVSKFTQASSAAYQAGFSKLSESLKVLCSDLQAALREVRKKFVEDIGAISERFDFLENSGEPLVREASQTIMALAKTLLPLASEPLIDSTPLADMVIVHTQPAFVAIEKIRHDVEKTIGTESEPTRQMRSLEFAIRIVFSQVTEASEVAGVGLPKEFEAAFGDLLALAPQFQATPGDGRVAQRDAKLVLSKLFAEGSDTLACVYQSLRPESRVALFNVWRNLTFEKPRPRVFALRKRASVFGHNAPKRRELPEQVAVAVTRELEHGLNLDANERDALRTNVVRTIDSRDDKVIVLVDPPVDSAEGTRLLFLDNAYEKILPHSYVAIRKPDDAVEQYGFVDEVQIHPRTAYGISTQTTKLRLAKPWWKEERDAREITFDVIRGTTVLVESEELELAERPMDTPERPEPVTGDEIELDGLYEGLPAGRVMILTGERVDLVRRDKTAEAKVEGVYASEFIVIVGVEHSTKEIPGDKPHTTLFLAKNLQHQYVRESVKIYGNVAPATHGESHGKPESEVLGSGNAGKSFQQFELSSSPLTYFPAPTAAGALSTLTLRVNNIEWHETEGFAERQPTDRVFSTRADEAQLMSVVFGDGRHGARLPTGMENVTATYRTGIGTGGNVKAQQINQLAGQILGVKEVVNPLPASGGADPESRDQARRNAPLPVMALDRLLSVQDYADFARTFAGIGKAAAARLSDGRRELVHVTVAGAGDIPIDTESELFRNLYRALLEFGDPQQFIRLDVRELALLIIEATVKVLPDYEWESVEREVRRALQDELGFERRELAQDVTQSEVIATIQRVPGVAFVDLNLLHSVAESTSPGELVALAGKLSIEGSRPSGRIAVNAAGTKIHIVTDDETLTTIGTMFQPRTSLEELRRLNLQFEPDEKLPKDTPIVVSRTWPAQIAYLSRDVSNTLILSEAP